MRPVPGPRATRRTAIGGALTGAVVLAGCDLDPPAADPPSSPTTPTTSDDPDSVLVDAVIAELDELVALVTEAAERRPLLAPELAAFAALHQAHRQVLPERDGDVAAPRITGSPRDVGDLVRNREHQTQSRLADWAVAAESGALARLLASMSAGVAAHLAATGLRGSAR